MIRRSHSVQMVRLIACALIVAAVGPVSVGAQTPAAPAMATPAQAAPFLGDWAVAAEGPQGPTPFLLTVKVTDGKVGAEISSERMPDKQAITNITRTGEVLSLKYSLDFQGNSVPVVVTLTPAAETLKVTFDFGGGQFTLAGTGTKKK